MTVKQLSVFLENKPGQLADFTKVLYDHGINMRAMCLADAKDFGILRIIVDDSYDAACFLKEAGYVFSITPVLAVAIEDKPGSLMKILELLGANGVNLEYTYAFTSRKEDLAYMILRVHDNEKAIEVLTKNGLKPICQDEFSDIFDD